LKNLFLGVTFTFAAATLSAQKSPAGYFLNAFCLNEDETEYFYEDGTVIQSLWSCGTQTVKTGTWSLSGREIKIRYTKKYANKPVGEHIHDVSDCGGTYPSYTSEVKSISETSETIWYDGIAEETGDDDACRVVKKMDQIKDVHSILRSSFVGKYDASARLLTESELQKYSAYELKIMRNEIFARYGFKFMTKEMKEYFGKQSGYEARLDDVSPFLSDIEIKNIATIKKMEATKK
jgi:hypothetical protein